MPYLLRADDGRFVSSTSEGGLELVDRCGDSAIWSAADEESGSSAEGDEPIIVVFHSVATGAAHAAQDCASALGLSRAVEALPAPDLLPSEYLRQLRSQGYVSRYASSPPVSGGVQFCARVCDLRVSRLSRPAGADRQRAVSRGDRRGAADRLR